MLPLLGITCMRVPVGNAITRSLMFSDIRRRDLKKSLDDLEVPAKPKKPASPFLKYLKESRITIQNEYPNATYQDIMKIAAEKWRVSSSEFKKPYVDGYKNEKQSYLCNIDFYEANLTEGQRAIIDDKQALAAEKREKARVKKGLIELGKPKAPANPYALFLATKKGMKNPGDTKIEWVNGVAREWKNLPDIQKKPFIDQYKALRLQFEKDISQWRKEAVKVKSENPVIKKAQQKIVKIEERHQEELLKQENGKNLEE